MDNTKYWIWLSLALDVATPTPHRLLACFSQDIEKLYQADSSDLSNIKLTDRQKRALLDKSLVEAERITDWCKSNNVKILCFDDPRYPRRLAEIPDAPLVLYYIGELYDIDSRLCLAGVGTREMTRYGRDSAYAFSHDIARCGAIVVSGMASGIDTICHKAALDAGGATIAVLGCRINKVYPPQNRDLQVSIARKGLLITEFHPFYKTTPSNFPKRNRIISGLCQGTIVFEADSGSGSLITARLAHKQGRNVYALPGNIGNSNSNGTNELIRNGAKIITRTKDIVSEYEYIFTDLKLSSPTYDLSPTEHKYDSFKAKNSRKNKESLPNTKQETFSDELTIKAENSPDTSSTPCICALSEAEQAILSAMSPDKPVSVECINAGEYTAAQLLSALTMLELKGLVRMTQGGKYIRIS